MTKSPTLPPVWSWVPLFFLFLVVPSQAEVSLIPPGNYQEQIRPLLTPLEEVKKRPDAYSKKDEPGRVALVERVTLVKEDGTYLRALHCIYQPYTQKGAEDLATDRYRYYLNTETIHLAMARTIQADGTEKPVAANAAFTQKGERSSGSIYDDAQDLVVVFPDVKPGAWCEAIVVYECTTPKVAGGYGEMVDWTGGWSISERRHVIDLPKSWETRLKTAHLGRGCPDLTSIPAPADRARWELRRTDIDRMPYEPMAAPAFQVGPATWLSTFSSWDEFAGWYQKLLTERNNLDEELRQKVDEWTAAAKTPREILDILYDHVANDVRYEGLEFGLSGLQPYACSTVWKNQYGDCKDKANLLVAMLAHKGIPARLVLVNTEHAGLVIKDIPDYRHFNHAIALVELPTQEGKTEQIFCDGTMQHGRPGLLSPSTGNREVLAIKDGKAEWVRTPPATGGVEDYQFDMEMTAEGRLSGWMTLKSTGCYAVAVTDAYVGVDKETTRERLRLLVSGFITGAEIVDFVPPAAQRTVDETVLKVYFTSPPRQMDHEGRLSLPFLSSARFYNDYGEGKDRRTSYFQWPDRLKAEARIHLPPGWTAVSVPQPFKVNTPYYRVASSWSVEGAICKTSLETEVTQSVIPADSVAVVAQANRAISSWVAVPLFMQAGASGSLAPSQEIAQVEMELMPTGNGQMNLVNRLFPREASAARRRAALEKVIQFFPNDPATVFEAKSELAYQFITANDANRAVAAFGELAAHRPEGVNEECFGYARYFLAVALRKTDKPEEAISIWKELAANDTLSPYRRAWSATLAGETLLKKRPLPPETLTLLRQAMDFKEDAGTFAFSLLVPSMVECGEGESLVKQLADGTIPPQEKKEAFTELVEQLKASITSPGIPEILPWLKKARDLTADETTRQLLTDTCAALDGWMSRGNAYSAARNALNKAISEEAKHYLNQPDPGETAAKVEEKLTALYGKDQDGWMRLAAAYFQKFEPSPEFAKVAWQFLWYAGREQNGKNTASGIIGNLFSPKSSSSAFFEKVAAATDLLPTEDSYYTECQIIKAKWLLAHNRPLESQAIYQKLKEATYVTPDFQAALSDGMGETHEAQSHWDEAISCYLEQKENLHQSRLAVEDVFKAGLLQARTGKRKAALQTWSMLQEVPVSVYGESLIQVEISTAIVLAQDEAATFATWDKMDEWWKEQFLPFFKSLQQGPVGEPGFYLQNEGTELDLRCRAAMANRQKQIVARDLASVAISVRFLPCQVERLYQFMTLYGQPTWPDLVEKEIRLLRNAAASSSVGPPQILEYNLRLNAGLSIDLKEPETALTLLEGQTDEAPGRSEEHRVRSGYLYGMAAFHTGKKMPAALTISESLIQENSSYITRSMWVCLHADLLAKTGKQAEALAYLKQQSSVPEIKNSRESLAAVQEKLTQLSKTQGNTTALAAAVQKFLQKNKPRWYDYAGPTNLQDPRIENPEKILTSDLEGFENPEKFRLYILLALSEEVPTSTREEAFMKAVLHAAHWKVTWKEALAVWSQVLDDESLSPTLRLPLLWMAATEAAEAGQTEILAILKVKRVFHAYTDLYSDCYYPLLQQYAAGVAQGPEMLQKSLLQLGKSEVDAKQMEIASEMHLSLLKAGDMEGALKVREATKGWKFAPNCVAQANNIRLAWMRQASAAREAILLDRGMLASFLPELEVLAEKAPPNWRQRMDLTDFQDLPEEQAQAIRAAVMTSGFMRQAHTIAQWFIHSEFWFGKQKASSVTAMKKALPHVLAMKNDVMANLAMRGMLGYLIAPAGGGWQEVDDFLDQQIKGTSRPALNAQIQLWKFYRNFKPGNSIPASHLFSTISLLGKLTAMQQSELVEVLISNKDQDGLESIMDDLDPKAFTSAYDMEIYLDALRLLQRDEELELVKDKAEQAITKEMLNTWESYSLTGIRRTCDLALSCNRRDLIPPAWKKDMQEIQTDPTSMAYAKAYIAALNEKWPELLEILQTLEPLASTDTEWHWLMGRALAGLGKNEAAKSHLEAVFIHGPIDAPHFRHAALLLGRINQKNH